MGKFGEFETAREVKAKLAGQVMGVS